MKCQFRIIIIPPANDFMEAMLLVWTGATLCATPFNKFSQFMEALGVTGLKWILYWYELKYGMRNSFEILSRNQRKSSRAMMF